MKKEKEKNEKKRETRPLMGWPRAKAQLICLRPKRAEPTRQRQLKKKGRAHAGPGLLATSFSSAQAREARTGQAKGRQAATLDRAHVFYRTRPTACFSSPRPKATGACSSLNSRHPHSEEKAGPY